MFKFNLLLRFICSTQKGIGYQFVTYTFAAMYFKVSMRNNPATGACSGYYRLVESYRDHLTTGLVRKLYDALKYKYAPSAKRESVIHKSELENYQFIEKQ